VWFLEAVAWRDQPGGADLSEVIGAGDAINHAIFNIDEIERAVNRLTAAGLLTEREGRFSLTSDASGIRRRSTSKSVYDRMRWMQQVLPTERLTNVEEVWRLDGGEYARATAAYHDQASAAMNRIYRDRP
jgi:hypothetical protein